MYVDSIRIGLPSVSSVSNPLLSLLRCFCLCFQVRLSVNFGFQPWNQRKEEEERIKYVSARNAFAKILFDTYVLYKNKQYHESE